MRSCQMVDLLINTSIRMKFCDRIRMHRITIELNSVQILRPLRRGLPQSQCAHWASSLKEGAGLRAEDMVVTNELLSRRNDGALPRTAKRGNSPGEKAVECFSAELSPTFSTTKGNQQIHCRFLLLGSQACHRA